MNPRAALIRRLLLAALVTMAAAVPSVARALAVSDPVTGYSFGFPSDWVQIPKEELDRRMTAVVKPGQVNFVAAYEPASHPQPFLLPYVVVQSVDYPAGRVYTTVTERELRQIAADAIGVSDADLQKALTPGAAAMAKMASKPTASYFTSPPGVVMDLSIGNPGGLIVHDHAVAHLGRSRMVMVHYYMPETEIDANKSIVDGIATTLALAPAQRTTLHTGLDPLQKIIVFAVSCAILAVLLVPVVLYLIFKNRKV